MRHTFKGGLRFSGRIASAGSRMQAVVPETVTIPLSRTNCPQAIPVVSPGEPVAFGQLIARAGEGGCPVHSSVSGTVVSLDGHLLADGRMADCIVIAGDGKNTPAETVMPCRRKLSEMPPEELLARLREGGFADPESGLPLDGRLAAARGRVRLLIVSAVETEPYLSAARRLATEAPKEITGGAKILLRALGARNAVLAVNRDATAVVRRLETAVGGSSLLRVVPIVRKYPAEHPLLLTRVLTGHRVPAGGQPEDAGCFVIGAELAAAVYRLFAFGEPMVRRILRVDGDCLSHPRTLLVPLGCGYPELLRRCDIRKKPRLIMSGGPMTGCAAAAADVPVEKHTAAVLAFAGTPPEKDPAGSVCIRCGRCAAACPARLPVGELLEAIRRGDAPEAKRLGIRHCLSCGVCTSVCPGRLDVSGRIREAQDGAPENLPEGGKHHEP